MAWKKGQSGNSKGRKKSEVRLAFENAVKKVEKAKKKKFFEHVVECAWTDPGLMKEVLKKLVPDLKQQELNLNAGEDLKSFISWLGGRNGDTENKS
jgi:hypothetical protein